MADPKEICEPGGKVTLELPLKAAEAEAMVDAITQAVKEFREKGSALRVTLRSASTDRPRLLLKIRIVGDPQPPAEMTAGESMPEIPAHVG